MSEPNAQQPGHLQRFVILAIALGLLALGCLEVWPWISDDAFISLRYAERFYTGHGLTWTGEERVEGYSNLLWILLTCALRPLGLDWVTIVRTLGIAAMALSLFAIVHSAWLRRSGLAPIAAVLALAALAPTALWTIGGLETPLALLLTTAGFLAIGRLLDEREERLGLGACAVAGGCFALLCWTRPDGPLAGALACLAILFFARSGPPGARAVLVPRLLAVGGPTALAVVLQLAFRLAYYGDYVPNTAHVKVGVSAATIALGVDYLLSAATILRSVLATASLGLLLGCLDRRTRPMALLCGAFVAGWAFYVAAIGGDLFPLCRILMPVLGPLVLLSALGFRQLARSRAGAVAAWTLAIASAALAHWDSRLDRDDPYQQISNWEWQGKASGEWLGRAFADGQPLLALDAAGGVPFYSRLPCLDMLGLNDRHIATAPLPRSDHVLPGHSRGDGGYVLDREPDLVLFASPLGVPSPRWPGGWQMEADPRFLRDYRCVVFRTGPVPVTGSGNQDLKLTLWVRQNGRAGAQEVGDRLVVPGYLLGGHRQAMPFHLSEPGGLRAEGGQLQRAATAALAMKQWWDDEAIVGTLVSEQLHGELRRPGTWTVEGLSLARGDYDVATVPPGLPLACELLRTDAGCDLRVTVRPEASLPLQVHSIEILRRR